MNNIIEELLKKIKKIMACVLSFVKSRVGILTISLFLLLLAVSLVIGSCVSNNKEAETTADTEYVTDTTVSESIEETEETTEAQPLFETGKALEEMEIPDTSWAYFLINRSNPVKDGLEDTLELDYIYSNGTKYLLDARITDFTEAMINDAYDDGVTLLVCSAYRTLARQSTNFENSLRSYARSRYNFAAAYRLTAGYIAVPGTSEHQTGLAIDFVTPGYMYLDSGFEDTAAYKWLSENSYKYGFILRYPSDKSELTGINYEPWHFRFIGFEHAQKIYESGLCLEEYMEREKENYPEVQFNLLGELMIPSEPLWYNLIKNAPETEAETEIESESETDNESIDSITDSDDTPVESETDEDFPDWLMPVEDESDSYESDSDETDFDENDSDETASDEGDSDESDSYESDTVESDELLNDTDTTDIDTDSDTYTETDDTSELTDSETEPADDFEDAEAVSETEAETEAQVTDETELESESEDTAENDSESLYEEEI